MSSRFLRSGSNKRKNKPMNDFMGDSNNDDDDLSALDVVLRDKYRNTKHFRMKSKMLSWAEVLEKVWKKVQAPVFFTLLIVGLGTLLSLLAQFQIWHFNQDSACELVCHPQDHRLHDDECWCLPGTDKPYKKDTGELP